MEYNTEQKRLILPEYGRIIQNMVDHCVSLPDRNERQNSALAIIGTMGNLFPHLRDISDFKHILWDHLAIMADFKLDIDFPYEVIRKEDLYRKPYRLPYNNSRFRYRHYGIIIERMIAEAINMEDGADKQKLIFYIAMQMKRSYIVWNKDTVDNGRIFADLYELSKGRIKIGEGEMKLPEAQELVGKMAETSTSNSQQNNRKKKARKK
ncbi:MAG: DUF4290 domain-containing protein [Tannerellaceae bacterium]|jgi:hypothetical protein|nr:DUF4290 domain-containing protein [Tannerellaceae bacterium]